jgi:hypothetical protein
MVSDLLLRGVIDVWLLAANASISKPRDNLSAGGFDCDDGLLVGLGARVIVSVFRGAKCIELSATKASNSSSDNLADNTGAGVGVEVTVTFLDSKEELLMLIATGVLTSDEEGTLYLNLDVVGFATGCSLICFEPMGLELSTRSLRLLFASKPYFSERLPICLTFVPFRPVVLVRPIFRGSKSSSSSSESGTNDNLVLVGELDESSLEISIQLAGFDECCVDRAEDCEAFFDKILGDFVLSSDFLKNSRDCNAYSI